MIGLQNNATRCDREHNSCPSRRICARYTEERSGELLVAALNCRREAGASACDMFIGELPTTFKE